ncbi:MULTISPECIES: DUF4395 domain-containing protein [Gordonia]|uniref:DUF4395 domain-containing protein n=1 Tax=Gordonia alkanivorans CGMCC 6845 TaxID=1423140 RepID=W9DJ26_9ACTN|nr:MULTISPECIES: DUF4395 domain-containing protein [Gordonia]ETA08617.1 hypothetical protein V525_00520 [Gordonia alkanivorans CGMCC 6845]MDH3005279.1 DUF4395 domain-containing protein [Gordonia alkanivorans]MDH3014691.1 DUF4395 domain-containing protein [Gordonia alkanivorans]MDH3019217.1 DUF4395 domain-containing protein [Gordonia alkanivorans]MDH3022913.1 DUF4395 domain-containing protein [Gordonia alkanivorans]
MSVREVLTFPNPVNDYAARTTAGLVVALAVIAVAVNNPILYGVLALGFALRVASGPTLSPFGQLSVKFIVPKIVRKEKLVPGPPKRFAQTIGLVVSGTAFVLSLFGFGLAAQIATGILIFAATLEAVFGFCLGCTIFGFLQRAGIIPESVCEACNNISLRNPAAV